MKMLAFVLLYLAVIFAGDDCEARGVRGSSYRGGSTYRSSSSYRSYYSRSYTYRSYYSGTYTTYRYTPSIRYSRASYRGTYAYYYPMYYYLLVPSSYAVSGTTYNSGASGNICKNYQANENGTYLGAFKCPLSFEPSNYKYCCGSKELEYCCELKNSSALYGIIFGTLMALGLIIIVVMCSIKCYKSGNRKVNSDEQEMSHHNSRRPPPTYSQSQQHYPQGRLPPINRAAPPTGQTADYTSHYPPPPPVYM
ncbi:hypothetical protein EB796_007151 [Bugula neritina]|uniref:Shisa N-terminal domain-containing protein n=1 Tax=Bugula neritina TaxID=10212 RepID=A0A7J7K8I8_BUGNE|nr:hypothetical protein EB796_007151 [Bugula neritina]